MSHKTSIEIRLCQPPWSGYCELMTDSTDVRVKVDDTFVVQITCAFRCNGIWPRSAHHWPSPNSLWPNPQVAGQVVHSEMPF